VLKNVKKTNKSDCHLVSINPCGGILENVDCSCPDAGTLKTLIIVKLWNE